MNYSIPRQWQPYAQRLPTLLNLLLVVFIAFAVARLFWLIWPVEHTFAPTATSNTRDVPEASSIKVDQIAAAYMFGKQEKKDAKPDPNKLINAPETQLNLTLTGIVSSTRDHDSRALIKDNKNEQNPYSVGGSITNNVKLHAIYSNRVILDRSGRFETLILEQEKKARAALAQAVKTAPDSSASTQQVEPDVAEDIGQAREQILQDPSKASQYLRIQPERRDGKIAGYRVYPGSNRALFQKAGLRPGELVTAINGQSLENPGESLKLLGDLAQAPNVSVTLERGGQTRTLTVSFQ